MTDEPSTPSKGATGRLYTIHPDDDGIRLDRWIKRHLPNIPFAMVSRWSRTGQVRLDGKRAEPGARLSAGQQLRLPPAEVEQLAKAAKPARPPKRTGPPLTPDEIAFARSLVIHRDEHAIVINKPPGLATQGGTKTTDHVDRLLDALMFDLPHRPKLVHRLDKDTSGVLLVARTPRAAAWFAKSFSSRTARKIYWAIVAGAPSIEDGIIDLPIAKQPGTGGEKMYVDEKEGQPSRSRYRVIDRAGNRASWVELQPYTGRTHQLRVHMGAIGFPIVGDGKYGGPDAFLTGTISRKMHLHARRLRIDAPGGGMIDVTAEPPVHFAESIDQLGFVRAAGDLPIEDVRFGDTPEGKKKAEAQRAKSARKERKGERRNRGTSAAGAGGKGAGGKSAGGKGGGGKGGAGSKARRSDKPAAGKSTAGKTMAGKSIAGKSMAGKSIAGAGKTPAPRKAAATASGDGAAAPARTRPRASARTRTPGDAPSAGKRPGTPARPPRPSGPRAR